MRRFGASLLFALIGDVGVARAIHRCAAGFGEQNRGRWPFPGIPAGLYFYAGGLVSVRNGTARSAVPRRTALSGVAKGTPRARASATNSAIVGTQSALQHDIDHLLSGHAGDAVRQNNNLQLAVFC